MENKDLSQAGSEEGFIVSEVKECPFCGVIPKPFSYPDPLGSLEVTCDDEECPAFPLVCSISDWNKRAAQSELSALREELANAMEDIDTIADHNIDLQQRLTAAGQRNADLIDLIQKAHTWVDRNNFGGWDAYELRDQLAAALKPTGSGASE